MAGTAERLFMGWEEPLLLGAARRLLDGATRDFAGIDLSGTRVVVPGGRAGRLLVGFLVDLAEERGETVSPPEVTTPRGFVDLVLGDGRSAPGMARRLAWRFAIRDAGPEEIGALWTRRPESEGEIGRFALLIEGLSDELAQAMLRIDEAGERLDAPADEKSRWRALAGLQRRYEARLAEQGLVDPLLAAMDRARAGEATGVDRAALVGVTELTALERAALAASGADLEAMVFAPEELAGRFDGLGCVRVEEWAEAAIDLEEDRVVFARDPREEAERALAHVASLGDPVEASDVAIGSPEPEELGVMRRLADEAAGVRVRIAPGRPASLTAPGRLVALLAANAAEGSFDSFMALYRHPDAERAAVDAAPEGAEAERWLERLDEIRQEHVLQSLESAPETMRESRRLALSGAREHVEALFGALATAPAERRAYSAWGELLGEALQRVYGDREFSAERESSRRSLEALRVAGEATEELRRFGTRDEGTASGALALVLERLGRAAIAEPPSASAIEGLGWLELLTDPSPHAVVVGMTDDRVPGGRASDPLIPDSRRAALGLVDSRARVARDAYVTAALAASRDVVFMAPRFKSDGEPARVSRLLLRASGETLAHRVRRFTEGELPAAPRVRSRVALGEADRFRPSAVVSEGYEAPESVRVTDFRAFLRSPAGWYLERVLGLKDVEAPAAEMSAMLFGSLAHDALELYGRDERYWRLTDPAAVSEALSTLLDHAAAARFGRAPAAAVSLQRELLRRRLGFLAGHLAKRRQEGWEVLHVEWEAAEGEQGTIEVDGSEVRLRGKIDLIEARGDEWAILDFKTSSRAEPPEKTHFSRSKGWRDLQLPLYRHVVRSLDPPGPVRVGLAYVPVKEAAAGVHLATWDEETLLQADEAARDVIRRMRAMRSGEALEPGDHAPERGALGFITGARFEAGLDEEEAEGS